LPDNDLPQASTGSDQLLGWVPAAAGAGAAGPCEQARRRPEFLTNSSGSADLAPDLSDHPGAVASCTDDTAFEPRSFTEDDP